MAAGLYLHIPFCRIKCQYCDFYSITDASLIKAFLGALEQEILLVQSCHPQYDTLYLGGGTPSLLSPQDLETLFRLIYRHFTITGDAEITLETNPDDVTEEKLLLWRHLGVNRLSLGVQSFKDAELRFLGRRHDAAQARLALALAREQGFDNLSVDLMYALPGQTWTGWLASLKEAAAYQPEHLSCYQLTIADSTPLGKKLARGEFAASGEEEQRALFLGTSEFLESQGYSHYEVSNFARGERYFSRHNRKYWEHVPYLGLGPGAHSFDGRRRRWNVAAVEEYCRRLGEGRAPVAGSEVLSDSQLRLEALALGLRTRWGVVLAELGHFPQALQFLAGLEQGGLVTLEQDRICPTRAGFLVADSLAFMLSE